MANKAHNTNQANTAAMMADANVLMLNNISFNFIKVIDSIEVPMAGYTYKLGYYNGQLNSVIRVANGNIYMDVTMEHTARELFNMVVDALGAYYTTGDYSHIGTLNEYFVKL